MINDFNNWMFPEINNIAKRLNDNQVLLAKMNALMDLERIKLEEELDFYKSFSTLLIEESPDMVWLKDINGKYLVANTSIRTNLLFDFDPFGKDDIELSRNAKIKFGDENHTFGEVCGNSDLVILETLKPQRFLESGKVKGKMMYLEVFKFPFYKGDKLIGVGGIGRDLTDYVEAYRDSNCSKCTDGLGDIFSKWEFK
jgi:hypothetical protein